MIGRGAFGEVFKAKHKIQNQEYAIKRVYLPIGKDDEIFSHRCLKEVSILNSLTHKNIIRYYTFWIEMPPESFLQKFKAEFKREQNIQKEDSHKELCLSTSYSEEDDSELLLI